MKISNKKKKYFQTESIVLNLFNLGEADRIVTLLTPNYGIIRAVAKGVRKPNSRTVSYTHLTLPTICRV